MVKALLNGFLSLIMHLIEIVLYPLNVLIKTFIPSLTTALGYITGFFNKLEEVSTWVMSYTGLTSEVISIIISLIVAIVSIPLAVHSIKLIISWYKALKV